MSPAGRLTIWLVLVGSLGLGSCVAVLVFLAGPGEGRPVAAKEEKAPVPAEGASAPVPPARSDPPPPAGPRRLPVSGADGYVVVLEADGSSYLEGPGGKRTQLAERGPALVPTPPALPSVPPAIKEIGQLIVCDTGVVDVPKGAVITFVGRDKVVTRDEHGVAMTYYADGRVDTHVRERKDAANAKDP